MSLALSPMASTSALTTHRLKSLSVRTMSTNNPGRSVVSISSLEWYRSGAHLMPVCTFFFTLPKTPSPPARVGALAWNGTQLATGSRDNTVMMHDVRIREHRTATLTSHSQEVCGLKWAPSGNQLASGGNDNLLHIWDQNSIGNGTHLHRLDAHQAAVKALAWCPFQSNLLASGGGTADRCIKFWNTNTGALLNSVDTHSQVCSLQWNKHERELLSSHGYSQNQLCLWKYPTMTKMAELTGHSARVLHMAQSPDGTTVVSAAADETLRFWKCFSDSDAGKAKKLKDGASDSSVLRRFNFR